MVTSRKVSFGVILSLLVASVLLAVPQMPSRAAENFTIGVSLPSASDPFFIGMSNGVEAAANDLGVEIVVKAADGDPATELANVEALIAEGVNALVISPVGMTLSADVVAAVHAAGIPLVVTGAQVDLEPGEDAGIASVVLPYNEQGGWLAASLLCEAIGSAGSVIEVVDGSVVSAERSSGFNLYMGEMCTDASVQVLDVAGMDTDAVIDALVAQLSSGQVAGMIAYNADLTLALVDSAVAANVQSAIKLVGFDATDDVMIALQNGYLSAVVTPVGWLLGTTGIKTALDILTGAEVEDTLLVNMGVLDADSVVAFRGGPGSSDDPSGDPRTGSFSGGPGDGKFEGGPGDGKFEKGPGDGKFEGGPGDGKFEDTSEGGDS